MTPPDERTDDLPETGPNGHAGVSSGTPGDAQRDDDPAQRAQGSPGGFSKPSIEDLTWYIRVLVENEIPIIPIEAKAEEPHEFKEPTSGGDGWKVRRPLTVDEAVEVMRADDMAIGMRVGENGLLDLDLDLKVLRRTREGAPVHLTMNMDLAGRIILGRIPATPFVFGRDAYPVSHALFRVVTPFASEKIKLSDGRDLIDIRCLSKDGKIGLQSVVPPSRHRRGSPERRAWASPEMEMARRARTVPMLPVLGDAELDQLRIGLKEGAAILILATGWPAGNGHLFNLALAGLLAKADWTEDRARDFIWDVNRLCGYDGAKEYRSLEDRVQDTFDRHKRGENVSGWKALEGWLGESVLRHVSRLLDLGEDDGIAGNSILLDIKEEDCRKAILDQLRDADLLFVSGTTPVRVTAMPTDDALQLERRYDIKVPSEQLVMNPMKEIPLANLINKYVPLHVTRRTPSGKVKRKPTRISKADATWLMAGNEFGSIQQDVNRIMGVSPVPLIGFDGTLSPSSGYDRRHRMWIAWDGGDLPVPTQPTRDDAAQAVQLLNDTLLPTFSFDEPWEREVDKRTAVLHADWAEGGDEKAPLNRVAAIGALMTAVLRPSLPIAPYLVATSPQARTGKDLFISTCSHLALGNRPVQASLGDKAEEHAKRIPQALALGAPFLCFQNVDGMVMSADLEVAATEPTFTIRLYGMADGSRTISNRGVIAFTGNQSEMPVALMKRSLRIVLNAHAENPEARDFTDKVPPPIIALRERKKLLVAVFTIARWWCQNRVELKETARSLADSSFPDWTDMVRRPLYALTGVDIENTVRRGLDASPQVTDERRLIAAVWDWAKTRINKPPRPESLAEGAEIFTMNDLKRAAIDGRELGLMSDEEKTLYLVLDELGLASKEKTGVLGRRLRLLSKRIVNGIELVVEGGAKTNTYILSPVYNDPTASRKANGAGRGANGADRSEKSGVRAEDSGPLTADKDAQPAWEGGNRSHFDS